MKNPDMRKEKQSIDHPMLYEWAATENLSPLYHASDDFGFAMCNRTIRLHNSGIYCRNAIPEHFQACKKCTKLFRDMVINNCVAVRQERIRLGEIIPFPGENIEVGD